ncbi:MAG: hypothetical protein Q4F45_04320 [Alistipes sp.]|nr:hypothetical protein [Alistipes sp.]
MKKLVLMAACLFVCSSAMATHDDPPKNPRNEWSKENCKDAGVTTTVNNDYYTDGYKSQVTVNTPDINGSHTNKDAYQSRTTVTDYDGNQIDEIRSGSLPDKDTYSKSASQTYKRDVKAETECKFYD